MKTLTLVAAGLVAAAAIAGPAASATTPLPFPSAKAGPVFIASHTTTTDGSMSTWFLPGDKVVFRAYAIDTKSQSYLTGKDVKYFYVAIPGQPNVKLTYDAKPTVMASMPWSGTWTVPSSFSGQVNFRILVKTVGKHTGEFTQIPVSTAKLNIASNAAPVFGPAPTAIATTESGKPTLGLYVDSVNGTHPTGAAPRLVGCSQTNVFKRGEQFVLRVWGVNLKGGDVLSNDNVQTATASISGQPDLTLGWGAHGTAPNQVYFWSAPWNIPATFPLGTTTVHITYTLVDGTKGSYDYPINIIP
ncbi:MAG: hypothetical protein ABUS54_07590 [Actinomycetota bacterium]